MRLKLSILGDEERLQNPCIFSLKKNIIILQFQKFFFFFCAILGLFVYLMGVLKPFKKIVTSGGYGLTS